MPCSNRDWPPGPPRLNLCHNLSLVATGQEMETVTVMFWVPFDVNEWHQSLFVWAGAVLYRAVLLRNGIYARVIYNRGSTAAVSKQVASFTSSMRHYLHALFFKGRVSLPVPGAARTTHSQIQTCMSFAFQGCCCQQCSHVEVICVY
jgi:hypothetical protein